MGTITLKHSSNLYWLGRYAERVFTTLDTFFDYHDATLDRDKNSYRDFLAKLGIPDKYGDYDSFIHGYLYNDNPDGSSDGFTVSAAFHGAYDNALVLRNMIGSESLAYIQLASNVFYCSRNVKNLRLALMPAMDYLLAFWGSIDDRLASVEAGTIIKCGKLVERLDLYFRFSYDHKLIHREYNKLCHLLAHVRKDKPRLYNTEQLSPLVEIMGLKEAYGERLKDALDCLNKLIEERAA